jgi:BirA family biotin operon repressor/biotin-[acetyl-CoA-carboxylase] ligase
MEHMKNCSNCRNSDKGAGKTWQRMVFPYWWIFIILRPKLRPVEVVKLTFVVELAVAKVLGEMFGLKVETKWPNDMLVNGRKICGILTEMNTTCETVDFVVVGIGGQRGL